MSTLSSLQSEKREKEKLLKSYKKRLEQVKTVHDDVSSDFSNNVSSINSKLDAVISNCADGIMNCISIFTQNDTLNGLKEKGSDYSLSETKSYLSSEISRINNEIRDIQNDIDNLDAKIKAANQP